MNAMVASARINEIFRRNVREAMRTRGASISGMARDLGIDYSGFHAFLSGKNGVSLDRAAKIAEYLETPLASMLEETEVEAEA